LSQENIRPSVSSDVITENDDDFFEPRAAGLEGNNYILAGRGSARAKGVPNVMSDNAFDAAQFVYPLPIWSVSYKIVIVPNWDGFRQVLEKAQELLQLLVVMCHSAGHYGTREADSKTLDERDSENLF
jgi:hypothetical protein